MLSIQVLSVLGILLSLYTLYLHWKINKEYSYKAVCDLSDRFSCTKSIRSKEGKIFGIPNGVFGIGFYGVLLALTFSEFTNYIVPLTTIGVFASFYFAYNLYFKVKTICLVCNSIYLVNLLLFISVILEK
jgi:vitamin-K-epoxide reductase (warfarin-sensitive)